MATVKSLVKQLTVMTNEEKKKIKEKELYNSSPFKAYISSLVDGMCVRFGIRGIRTYSTYDSKNQDIAYTNGDRIFLNCENTIMGQFKDMEARFAVNLGVLFHEVGHILFLDFDGEKRMMEAVSKGEFPGAPPVPATAEEEADLKELVAAMQNPAYTGVFMQVYHELSNTIADPHDEDKMIGTFSYLIERGIVLAREGLIRTATSLENMIAAGVSKLSITFSLLLQEARFGTFLALDPADALQNSEYTSVIRRCLPNVEAARLTDDTEVKFSNINQIVLAMWPCIKEEVLNNMPPQQPQQGDNDTQSQDQSGQGSDSQSSEGQGGQYGSQEQNSSGNQQQATDSQEQNSSGNPNAETDSQTGSGRATPGGGNDSQSGNEQQKGSGSQSQPGNGQQGGNSQQSTSSSQQGSGVPQNPTQQLIDAIMEALEEAMGNAGQTKVPERSHSSKAAQDGNKSSGAKNSGNDKGGSQNQSQQGEKSQQGKDGQQNQNGQESQNGQNDQNGEQGQNGQQTKNGQESQKGKDDQNGQQSQDGQNDQRGQEGQNGKNDQNGQNDQNGSQNQRSQQAQEERQELGSNAIKNALNQIIESIAEEKASQKLDKELCDAVNVRVQTVDRSSSHKNVPLEVYRSSNVTEKDIESYNTILAEVKDYSKHLQKRMLAALKERATGKVFKNRLWGNEINVSEAYRQNGRYWIKKNAPDMPSMAVSVLVDNSGSMHGPRIEAAKRAAILLYDFCRGLKIPVHIAGHNTDGYACCYHVCADYDAVGKYDGYRITKMKPDGCNRDGMAVEIAADLLAQRQEQVKLLFVISDGQPNHHNYGGASAMEDIKSIVRKYSHKGVITYAAAIGDDKDRIKSIYGEQMFLDITNLDDLPKTLTKLVVKYLDRH